MRLVLGNSSIGVLYIHYRKQGEFIRKFLVFLSQPLSFALRLFRSIWRIRIEITYDKTTYTQITISTILCTHILSVCVYLVWVYASNFYRHHSFLHIHFVYCQGVVKARESNSRPINLRNRRKMNWSRTFVYIFE